MEIKTSWLGRIFCKKYDALRLTEDSLCICKNNRIIDEIPFKELSFFTNYTNVYFSSILTIHLDKHIKRKFIWLNKKTIIQFCKEFNNKINKIVNDKIKNCIKIFNNLIMINYPRDSWKLAIEDAINNILYYKPLIELVGLVNNENIENINRIFNILPADLSKLQKIHEDEQLLMRKDFFDSIEKYPLTEEQRLGVIRSNDFNMVLAAAGTGKTSVIISKVFDIIERDLCEPKDILVMAFNRGAANEIHERFDQGVQKRQIALSSMPEISTFHALGRKILKESGLKTTINIMAEDQIKLNQWITKWIYKEISENIDIFHMFLRFIPEPLDPFNCTSQTEYEKNIRDNEFRTLLDEKVRGYQEMIIANYLFLHSVPYKYEEPYVTKRRIEENIDYRPDFHISNTDIYIEHFGINRDGSTRKDISKEKYNNDMLYKRQLHQEQGTILIETYHYEWKEGTLLDNLSEKLKSYGINLKPRTKEEIKDIIDKNRDRISLWGDVLMKALAAIRIENLDADGIGKRLKSAKLDEWKLKSRLLSKLLDDYKSELIRTQSIDFDDMILRSSDQIESGKFLPHWKYILVDEFQDISTSRMNLIKNLVKYGPKPSLTVVGDDWQAIYRFAGGKLEFTTKFSQLVGLCTSTFLRHTFRYHDNIASVSEKFVTENPNQVKKNVIAHDHVDGSKIFLHDHFSGSQKDYPGKVSYILDYLRKHDKTGSIAIIARYNYILKDIKDNLSSEYDNIYYWTFHKSKGLEADHAIIVGLTQGKLGFPSENRDEAMVAALLPLDDHYPHSEERRLMYVGMTRPKYHLHIIADPQARSEFVEELLSAWYNINIISPYFKKSYKDLFKCRYCATGYLRKMSGQFGDFYACSTGLGCPVGKARVCEKCGYPSIDAVTISKCTNPECGYSFPICEKCGRPMRERNGKYGKFLGCSGYGIKTDQCKNTRPIYNNELGL